MSEFYTPDVIQTIREQELEMEQWQLAMDKYDPYLDDDFICSYCEDEDTDCRACGVSDINEDLGFEGYLFGWDS